MIQLDIEAIKQKMKDYRDIFGGELNKKHLIDDAKNLLDLDDIFSAHFDYIKDMASDAESHLVNFKRELKVN